MRPHKPVCELRLPSHHETGPAGRVRADAERKERGPGVDALEDLRGSFRSGRCWQILSAEGQTVNTLAGEGHASVKMTWLCHCPTKGATDAACTEEYGCVPMKLCLHTGHSQLGPWASLPASVPWPCKYSDHTDTTESHVQNRCRTPQVCGFQVDRCIIHSHVQWWALCQVKRDEVQCSQAHL